MPFSKFASAGLFAAATMAIVACGDSGTSASKANDPTAPVKSQMSVNEIEKTITLLHKDSADLCVYENADYSWENRVVRSDTSELHYLFVEDTLVLYHGEYDREGLMLVGGKEGDIYGSWKTTVPACTYDVEDEESDCDLFEKGYYYKYDLSENSAVVTLVITNEDSEAKELEELLEKYRSNHQFKDFAHSELTTSFMRDIYYGEFDDIYAMDAFEEDSSGFASLVKNRDIEFEYKNENNITLVFGGKYEVGLSYNGTKMADDETSYKVELAVTYKDAKAELSTEGSVMTKSLCKADNEAFFDIEKARDPNGNKFTYVSSYAKSNIKNFRSALEDMFASVAKRLDGDSGYDYDYDYSYDYYDSYYDLFKKKAVNGKLGADEVQKMMYLMFK